MSKRRKTVALTADELREEQEQFDAARALADGDPRKGPLLLALARAAMRRRRGLGGWPPGPRGNKEHQSMERLRKQVDKITKTRGNHVLARTLD